MCVKNDFSTMPVSVMNFLEGPRFTKGKHAKQQSPYTYLLRPKAGGIAFVWVNDLWAAKDKQLQKMHAEYPPN